MVEKIGECVSCKKNVYCTNGFLNGIVINSAVYCFTCADEKDQQNESFTN